VGTQIVTKCRSDTSGKDKRFVGGGKVSDRGTKETELPQGGQLGMRRRDQVIHHELLKKGGGDPLPVS